MAGAAQARPPAIVLALRDRGVQLVSIIFILGVWAAASLMIGTFAGKAIVPGPIEVFPTFARLIGQGLFIGPLLETLSRTVLGFVVAFSLGTVIGITTAKVPTFKMITGPSMSVLLFAPTLVLIYLGTSMIGVGYSTIAVIAGLVVAPNVSIYMRDVMADFDPDIATMADSYKIPTRQRLFEVYIPYLIPAILAASRISFSQSWKVVMLTEVFGMPGGLGYEIKSSYYIHDLNRMMAFLIIFIAALLIIEQVIRVLEHRIVKWKA